MSNFTHSQNFKSNFTHFFIFLSLLFYNHLVFNMLNIKEEREKRGLTQEEFAELLGVTRKTIVNYESGSNIPETKEKIFIRILSNTTLGEKPKTPSLVKDGVEVSLEEAAKFVALNFKEARLSSRLLDLEIKNDNRDYLIEYLESKGHTVER